MTATTVDLADQALGRAHRAELLGRLIVSEPGPEVAGLVEGIVALEAFGRSGGSLAVEYERVLLREVPPYESVFLGEGGQRGGPVAAAVVEVYQRHEFNEHDRWRVAGPDHIGIELTFYARLCAEEAAGWRDDAPERAAKAVEAEREWLALHLGRWAEVALAAIERRSVATPYSALAAASQAFLAAESELLRPAVDHPGLPEVEVESAPARLGPAKLARWLLSPRLCGGYLDSHQLGQASAALDIPWRASDPRSHFARVVESAIDGGELPELLAGLRPVFEAWARGYAAQEADRDGDRRLWRQWRLRADETVALIDRSSGEPVGRGRSVTGGPVVVEVEGPDRVARLELASAVMRALGDLGTVAVSLDLEAAVSEDLRPLLAAGATEVLLAGDAISALAWGDGGDRSARERRHLPDVDIVVRVCGRNGPASLRALGGSGAGAEDVGRRLAALQPGGAER